MNETNNISAIRTFPSPALPCMHNNTQYVDPEPLLYKCKLFLIFYNVVPIEQDML